MTELINISDINQYLYCPRRYWYLKFYDTQGRNYYRIDGKLMHENQSKKGGWTREKFMKSRELGVKGKIDVVEGGYRPVERKRADDFYYSDEIQLAGYCMLLELNIGESVHEGIIYLYGTDQRISLVIEEWHRKKVKETIQKMRSLDSNNPPPLIENTNKCKACSAKSYCMPFETRKLEGDNV